MKIAVGCDEAGVDLKELLKRFLSEQNVEVDDYGTYEGKPVLYPDVAFVVAEAVAAGKHDRAILCCGTGIGMAICANKVRGIRAAVAHDVYSAERARRSNDAQVLALGARVIGPELAKTIVGAWLRSEFEPRSAEKVARIRAYEAARAAVEPGPNRR